MRLTPLALAALAFASLAACSSEPNDAPSNPDDTGASDTAGTDASDAGTDAGNDARDDASDAATDTGDDTADASEDASDVDDDTTDAETPDTDEDATDASNDATDASEDTTDDTGDGPACGDGRVDDGEDCDDGNTTDGDGCDATCTTETCGNGVVQAGEECDDGDETAACDTDCTYAACGDTTVNAASGETCDAGEETAECDVDCTEAACGDGVVNASAGEQCDGEDDCTDACAFVVPDCADVGLGLVEGPGLATGDMRDGTDDFGEGSACPGFGEGPDIAFAWRAPRDGTFRIDTVGSTYDTILRVQSSCGGEELTCNDDAPGLGTVSAIVLDDVVAGTEYIIVLDAYNSRARDYVLNIYEPDVCGNGVVEGDEECDSVDGCNDECVYAAVECATDADLSSELDVRFTGSTADWTDDFAGACGEPGGADALFDWFTPYDGEFIVHTRGSSFDTVLRHVEDCDGDELACSDDLVDGRAGPSELLITADRIMQPFRFVIDGADPDAPGTYDLSFWWVRCGDGYIQGSEECEDGNVAGGDGCSSRCRWEWCGNGVRDTFEDCDGGDSCADDCRYASTSACEDLIDLGRATGDAVAEVDITGRYNHYGRTPGCGPSEPGEPESGDAVFAWTAPSAGAWVIDTTGTPFFEVLRLVSDCWPRGRQLTCTASGAFGGGAQLVVAADAGETVHFVLDGWDGWESGVGVINIHADTCGNGILSPLEACDDGNTAGGDGCAADCRLEAARCVDTPLSNGLFGSIEGDAIVTGTTEGGDDSFGGDCGDDGAADAVVRWTAPRDGEVRFDAFGSDFDTVVRVVEASCTGDELACGDDGARDGNGAVIYEVTDDTTYFIVIDGADADEAGDFVLNVNYLRAPYCGDGRVNGADECDDGNPFDGDGCSATCRIEAE